MKIRFIKGFAREEGGGARSVVWAETPFAAMAMFKGDVAPRVGFDTKGLVIEEELTTVDLAGLGKDDTLFMVGEIMQKGYLDKPGATHREDSVLYTLVNEALRELDKAHALLENLEAPNPEESPIEPH
jgi:hypothetical protein